MHIFVINLVEDNGRREAIEKQLQELGLLYEIFPAVRGRILSAEQLSLLYDDKWFVRYEGRSARLGEIGCALSHVAVYRKIVERNLPHALVLEDDAWLNPNLPQLLLAIREIIPATSRDVILLTWVVAMTRQPSVGLWSSYRLADIWSAYCTHGYVVTNAAACALLEALYPIRHVADCWRWLRRHGIVRIRAVYPTCITSNLMYETGTTPELARFEERSSLWRRIQHKFSRGFWVLYDKISSLVRSGNIV